MLQQTQKWTIRPTPKCGRPGTSRLIPSSETVKNVLPVLRRMEVESRRDIVRVDTDGIPIFVCKRTGPGGRAIYYKGKGYSGPDSRASALMEAAERFSAEVYSGDIVRGTCEEIHRMGPVVRPEDLGTRVERAYTRHSRVEWVSGFDLIARHPVFIPLGLVVFPYAGAPEYFRAGSVGLASGNTMEEAICHGLCESIEHDALGMADIYNPGSWRLVINPPGPEDPCAGPAPDWQDTTPDMAFPLIDPRTFPQRVARVARKLDDAGLVFFARNITTDINVASVHCIVAEKNPGGSYCLFSGAGTHPDASIALTRALCEAAQSHSVMAWLQQNNLWDQKAAVEDPWRVAGYGSTCAFSDLPSFPSDRVDQDIRLILDRLQAVGLNQAVAVDLTRPELGIPTVRITIPGTEYLYEEPDKKGLGRRAEKLLDTRMKQLQQHHLATLNQR